jgi:NAD-dependent dihydropyrimidine dehydrogenase PreA subunit
MVSDITNLHSWPSTNNILCKDCRTIPDRLCRQEYGKIGTNQPLADECIECGECEKKCPQQLKIREQLKENDCRPGIRPDHMGYKNGCLDLVRDIRFFLEIDLIIAS